MRSLPVVTGIGGGGSKSAVVSDSAVKGPPLILVPEDGIGGIRLETSELAGFVDDLLSGPDSELNGPEMATGDGGGASADEDTVGALTTTGAEVAGAAGGDATLELDFSELDEIEGASGTAAAGAAGGNVKDVDTVKFGTGIETIDG